jgi:hypothetical protein
LSSKLETGCIIKRFLQEIGPDMQIPVSHISFLAAAEGEAQKQGMPPFNTKIQCVNLWSFKPCLP